MSTIASNAEDLILNADGGSSTVKIKINGTEKASISSAGAFTSTTIDATALTGDLPAISGANLTGISSVGGATGVDFNDNVKARFGTGNDAEIYFDGTDTYIKSPSEILLRSDTNENMIKCVKNAQVNLYYDNAIKLNTSAAGTTTTGSAIVNAGSATVSMTVNGTGDYVAHFISDTNNSAHRGIVIQTGTDNGYGNNYYVEMRDGDGGEAGAISHNAGTTTYAGPSDYRLKENVADMTDATTRLKQLKPKRFNFIKDETNTLKDGFLAHEVSSVVPEAVIGAKDAEDSEGNPDYQGLDESKLVPLLVKTIQEQQATIESLAARITTLEG